MGANISSVLDDVSVALNRIDSLAFAVDDARTSGSGEAHGIMEAAIHCIRQLVVDAHQRIDALQGELHDVRTLPEERAIKAKAFADALDAGKVPPLRTAKPVTIAAKRVRKAVRHG